MMKRKRDNSDVAGSPRSRRQIRGNISHSTEHSKVSVEDGSIHKSKRKASDDGTAPEKKMRCSDSTSSESFITVSSLPESSIQVKEDVMSNLSSTLTDEKIFKMASTGNRSRADFENKYEQLGSIGKGSFGTVYEGFCKSDYLPVAIKHIKQKDARLQRVACNGEKFNIILEVVFMLKAAGLPGSTGQSAAVSLLDWYILDGELILVMERPTLSMDLKTYLKFCGGSLNEHKAKMILRQLVDAAIEMHSRGVFHRDIKLSNILVQLDSDVPRVRIIDFGCATFSSKMSYCTFGGTHAYYPPEWFYYKTYWADHTTVWQLGGIFYSLLRGHGRFTTTDFIYNKIRINRALSTEVKTLLYRCLDQDPSQRATLEELQLSPLLRQFNPPSTSE